MVVPIELNTFIFPPCLGTCIFCIPISVNPGCAEPKNVDWTCTAAAKDAMHLIASKAQLLDRKKNRHSKKIAVSQRIPTSYIPRIEACYQQQTSEEEEKA